MKKRPIEIFKEMTKRLILKWSIEKDVKKRSNFKKMKKNDQF